MGTFINFKEFRKDFNATMETLGKKYNITLRAGNITYDDNTFTVKVEAKRSDVDVDKINFMNALTYMERYGFKEDDYLKEFATRGTVYSIVGFKPGNKYDVVIKRKSDGKQYGTTHDSVIASIH